MPRRRVVHKKFIQISLFLLTISIDDGLSRMQADGINDKEGKCNRGRAGGYRPVGSKVYKGSSAIVNISADDVA